MLILNDLLFSFSHCSYDYSGYGASSGKVRHFGQDSFLPFKDYATLR